MLNGHRFICPKCSDPITELQMPYTDYVELSIKEREELATRCADEKQLLQMSAKYRMYKYSKWYRELQANNTTGAPITTLLAQQAE